MVENREQDSPPPQPLNISWLEKVLRLTFDLIIAVIALLFAVFGFWVFQAEGDPAGPGSTGARLFNVSQYAPTFFPVLFAAIAGSCMKSIAAWRVQTNRGATIGFLQQCLGSQTISSAFLTQIRLRALNLFAVFTLILWCLSPLGSQASLRVISIVPSYPFTVTNLTTVNTFTEYQYSYAEAAGLAKVSVANPVIASMVSSTLLKNRNQDLWGNIRFPVIKTLSNGSSGWMDIPLTSDLTYASLVGCPVATLPRSGNTSFELPGSYLSLSCLDFGPSNQTGYTNFTSSSAPSPGNVADCTWASAKGGSQYQIAISKPCSDFHGNMTAGTRNSRKLVWESSSDVWEFNNGSFASNPYRYTRATCDLTTTFVDVKVICTGSSSGTSAGSTCTLSSVRRSPNPPVDGNWTVLDRMDYSFSNNYDANAILTLIAGLFPGAEASGGQQPVKAYIIDPFTAVGKYQASPVYTIDHSVFEIRLGQILNAVLYLGINASAFTTSFDESSYQLNGGVSLNATVTTQQDIIKCNRAWLGVLITASLSIFVFALIGATLRIMTFAPDILSPISAVFLSNKIEGLNGSSTWSSDEWGRRRKDAKLYMGDVKPAAEVGCIALATLAEDVPVGRIKKGRYYS
ncbi:unnamed protein product [Penicillium manginii]